MSQRVSGVNPSTVMRKAQTLTEYSAPAELIVYLVWSAERGPRHRVLSEEVIHAAGGIPAIKREFEKESYWFVCLGRIGGEEENGCGITFRESASTALPAVPESAWGIGRRNPGFGRPELERLVFKSIFHSVERMFAGWALAEDRVVNAYALKKLRIGSKRLRALLNILNSTGKVYDVISIDVIKYWYPSSPAPQLPVDETILAEFTLNIPFEVRWSTRDRLISTRVMPISPC